MQNLHLSLSRSQTTLQIHRYLSRLPRCGLSCAMQPNKLERRTPSSLWLNGQRMSKTGGRGRMACEEEMRDMMDPTSPTSVMHNKPPPPQEVAVCVCSVHLRNQLGCLCTAERCRDPHSAALTSGFCVYSACCACCLHSLLLLIVQCACTADAAVAGLIHVARDPGWSNQEHHMGRRVRCERGA